MNFLAHIFLSADDPDLTIGNFIGDFVKGKEIEKYTPTIRKGIALHREIDHFTDHHPIVLKSKERLRPIYHHYAPVIVDVFYDHFLASDWNRYHASDLRQFTESFYQLTKSYKEEIPQRAQHMLSYMAHQNWLFHYRSVDGIHQALTGMSRRTSFSSGMEHASQDLIKNREAYEEEFRAFFPELQAMCQSFINSQHD